MVAEVSPENRVHRRVRLRGDERRRWRSMRIERRSQTGSFVLAVLIGSRGALTVSNLHSDKGGEDSFRGASYGFLVNC